MFNFLYSKLGFKKQELTRMCLDVSSSDSETILKLLEHANDLNYLAILGNNSLVENTELSTAKKVTLSLSRQIKHQIKSLTNLTLCNNFNIFKTNNALSTVESCQTLHIEESKINNIFLSCLLNKYSHIKTLNIKRCSNLNYLIFYKISRLNSLEHLHIEESNITSEFLYEILNNTQHLESINFISCNNLNLNGLQANVKYEFKKFNFLKKINIINSNINGNTLWEIIKNSPNIQEINIQKCNNLSNTAIEDNTYSFKNLKLLNINFSNTTLNFVCNIINQSPSLQILDLSDCKSLNSLCSVKLNILNSLKIIDVRRSNIEPSMLAQIIKYAMNVAILEFASCTTLKGMTFNNLPKFPFLKKVTTLNTNIPAISLALIIKNSPLLNTNKLVLLNCLESFSEYHPSIKYIAKLLVKHHQDYLTEYEVDTIFSKKCSEEAKFEIFSLFNTSWQDQIRYSCKSLSNSLDARIARIIILGEHLNNQKEKITFDGLVGDKILNFLSENVSTQVAKNTINYQFSNHNIEKSNNNVMSKTL